MAIGGIPAAEVDVDPSLVRTLLIQQHPDLAHLPLTAIGGGWDNALYRLGDDLLVRLPRRALAAPLIEIERRWLPELAPHLPVAVPVPVRAGRPGKGFPWAWSIVPWLPGRVVEEEPDTDLVTLAVDVAAFVSALNRPAPADAPRNPYRGVPLTARDADVRQRAARLAKVIDVSAVLAQWDAACAAPAWTRPPVWVHGDLHPGNLLVHAGHLSGVIDFGDLTAGDPAVDLSVAWTLLPASARPAFRDAVHEAAGPVDDDTWLRARGWALVLGTAFLAASRDSAFMRRVGLRAVEAVLEG